MVVDDCVNERRSGARLVVFSSWQSRSRELVPCALLPTYVTMSTAVGDVAELRDIDMNLQSRIRMLISPQGLASDTIDMREAVYDAATDEDRVNSGRREAKSRSDLGWPQSKPPAQVDDLLLDMLGRPAWDPVRLAGAILHPKLTLFLVATGPFPGRDRETMNIFAAIVAG